MAQYNMHLKQKGQIEMFGLAVIVVLITLGFFIYISFRSNEEIKNPKKEFTYDKTADDFVLAILHVSAQECKEFTINDLIIDCARDRRIECGENKSCIVLNNSITAMLNKTFMQYDTKFRFYSQGLVYQNEQGQFVGELFDISYKGCNSQSDQGRSGRAAIPTFPAPTVFLNLNICHQ